MPSRRMFGTALGAAAIGAAGAAAAQTATSSGGEPTFDRIRRTGVLRIAALPGETPFFRKDLDDRRMVRRGDRHGEEHRIGAQCEAGICRIHLRQFGARPAGQQDRPGVRTEPDAAARAGDRFHPRLLPASVRLSSRAAASPRSTWEDLNKPEIRVVSLIGSLSDVLLARYAPKAQVIGAKAGDDAILLMQAGAPTASSMR